MRPIKALHTQDSTTFAELDGAGNVQKAHLAMAKIEVLKTLQKINQSRTHRDRDYPLDLFSMQTGMVLWLTGAGLEITGHQNGGGPMAAGLALLGATAFQARPVIREIARGKIAQWKGFLSRYACPE